MLNQLHVVKTTAANSGGEGLAALRYAQAISNMNCKVTLFSRGFCDKVNVKSRSNAMFEHKLTIVRKNAFLNFFLDYRLILHLCDQTKYDLIHLHGM